MQVETFRLEVSAIHKNYYQNELESELWELAKNNLARSFITLLSGLRVKNIKAGYVLFVRIKPQLKPILCQSLPCKCTETIVPMPYLLMKY